MRIIKKSLIFFLIISVLITAAACSSSSNDHEEEPYTTITSEDISGVWAFTEDTIIYSNYKSQDIVYYSYNFKTRKNQNLGSVSNFATQVTNSVLMDQSMYMWVASGTDDGGIESVLIKINTENNTMKVLTTDTSESLLPVVYMFATDRGLLSLKFSRDESENNSWFELRSPDDGSVIETLEAPDGEHFELASFYGGSIYVLVRQAYDYFLREYDIETFSAKREINLEKINDFMQSGLVEMKVMGDYIYFKNISDYVRIAMIKDGEASEVLSDENLSSTFDKFSITGSTDILYRCFEETDNCYLFDYFTGEMTALTLPLKSGYTIQSIFLSGDQVLVCSQKEYSEKNIINIFDRSYFESLTGAE